MNKVNQEFWRRQPSCQGARTGFVLQLHSLRHLAVEPATATIKNRAFDEIKVGGRAP
jgi:hypothetical protein